MASCIPGKIIMSINIKQSQAHIKAAIVEYIETKKGYGVVINIAGVPVGKPSDRIYRKNPEMSGLGDVLCC